MAQEEDSRDASPTQSIELESDQADHPDKAASPLAGSHGRRGPLRLIIVFLLLIVFSMSLASAIMGLHDLYEATASGDRWVSAILLWCGLIGTLGAGYLLFGRSEAVPASLTWTLIVATVPAGWLFARQLIDYELDWRLVAWFVLAALPFITLALCIHSGLSPTWLASVTTAVVLSALLALIPLLMKSTTSTPQGLAISISLKVVGHRGAGEDKVAMVKVTNTVINNSPRQLTEVGSVYAVYAAKVDARSRPKDPETIKRELNASSWSGRYEKPHATELIETGFGPFPGESAYQPGESSRTSFVVHVPLERFNNVAIETWIVTGRSDRLDLEWPTDGPALRGDLLSGSRSLTAEWSIESGLWIDALTQRDRYLHIDYSYVDRNDPPYTTPYEQGMAYQVYADASADRTEPFGPYNDRLAATYGIWQASAYTELALDTEN